MKERVAVLTGLLGKIALNTRTVVGDVQHFGDVFLIPVVDVAFGWGGSAGASAQPGGGTGVGSGRGAWLKARALVVMKDGEVSLLPISPEGTAEKLVEAVPDLLEKLAAIKAKADQEAEGTNGEDCGSPLL